MTVFDVLSATEERFRERQEERQRNLESIRRREILKIAANTPERVAQRLRRLRADPALVQPGGQSSEPFPRALERVLHTNDLLGLRFFEQGLRVARAVGRIHIRGVQGQDLGYGTGFLVSSRLLLTNHHVLPSAAQAKRSVVEFNYQENASGEMQSSEVVELQPETLFLADADLDYALIAVAAEPGLAAYGWLPLISDLGKVLVGETVNIIQHPNGEPKQLAIRHNKVVDELEQFLHYQTDTDPGSSGSPVLNDQWEVVALHHSGVPKRNSQGEVLATDGRPWEEGMGEQRIAWEANEGVRVSRLVQHIREQTLSPEAEELRQELLEAAPPPLVPEAERPMEGEVWLSEEEGPPAPAAGQERWLLYGPRPPLPPPPPPAPPVTSADFRLASLASPGFDWTTSLSLCLASELAYKSPVEVKQQALDWGFQGCEFVEKKAAQGFLAWTEEVLMVTFRGTESASDWMSNLNVTTRVIPGVGPVHAGFLGQFQALQPELEQLLRGLTNGPLVVTGHSLGGGIAVLAAITWASSRQVRALYTYGQPAVAKGDAAATISTTLVDRYHRLVNAADIVPRVPPGYRHAGHLLHFDGQGRVTSKDTIPPGVPAGARGAGLEEAAPAAEDAMLSADEFEILQHQLQTSATTRGQDSTRGLVSDHMLPGYLNKIRRQMG
jgi:V8-like Glu-specific endopeptidase